MAHKDRPSNVRKDIATEHIIAFVSVPPEADRSAIIRMLKKEKLTVLCLGLVADRQHRKYQEWQSLLEEVWELTKLEK